MPPRPESKTAIGLLFMRCLAPPFTEKSERICKSLDRGNRVGSQLCRKQEIFNVEIHGLTGGKRLHQNSLNHSKRFVGFAEEHDRDADQFTGFTGSVCDLTA